MFKVPAMLATPELSEPTSRWPPALTIRSPPAFREPTATMRVPVLLTWIEPVPDVKLPPLISTVAALFAAAPMTIDPAPVCVNELLPPDRVKAAFCPARAPVPILTFPPVLTRAPVAMVNVPILDAFDCDNPIPPAKVPTALLVKSARPVSPFSPICSGLLVKVV